MQDAVAWLVQKDMVQVLLRAHLHQRQYVDQVQKVLKTLATEDGLQADHLELLWNLTEKVHTPLSTLTLSVEPALPMSSSVGMEHLLASYLCV